MSVRAIPLLVALLVAVAASLASRPQETPMALAEAFVQAANAADRPALERLVHPDVANFLELNHPERWEQVLTSWSASRFDESFDIVVRQASEVDLYDEERRTLAFGDKLRFRFAIFPPSHFLIIQMRGREAFGEDSVRPRLGRSSAVEAVIEDGGRWYLTVPLVEVASD